MFIRFRYAGGYYCSVVHKISKPFLYSDPMRWPLQNFRGFLRSKQPLSFRENPQGQQMGKYVTRFVREERIIEASDSLRMPLLLAIFIGNSAKAYLTNSFIYFPGP